jgi:hypothetical protein
MRTRSMLNPPARPFPITSSAAGGEPAAARTLARRPWRSALAAVALIASGTLVAGPASAQQPAVARPMLTAAAQTVKSTPRLAEVARWAQWGVDNKIPYNYGGGHGPTPSISGGADCSGFVRWTYYKGFGVDIGSGSGDSMIRTSGNFVRVNTPVPGDVVMLGRGGSAPAYHVSIYVGIRNGHPASAAESTSGQPAKIQYWYTGTSAQNFMGYWRYKGATAADLPQPAQPVQPARSATTVTSDLSSPVAEGQPSTVNITVRTTAGALVDNATVRLYQQAPGGAFVLGASVLASGGRAAVRIVGSRIGHHFQVRYSGNSRYLADDSPVMTQLGRPTVRATSGLSGTLRRGSVVKVAGATWSAVSGAKVQLQHYTSAGWIATGAASIVGADGSFGIYWKVGDGGLYRLATAERPSTLVVAALSPEYMLSVR